MRSLRAPAAMTGAMTLATATGLLLAGCGQDPAPQATGRTTTPEAVSAGPSPAPAAVTQAPVDEVWGLAQLVPPADLAVTSSVRRPDPDALASYLLVGTTTSEGATGLCDQLGGLLPVPAGGLPGAALPGWGLDAPPPGELGTCSAPEPVVPSIQRDVLVAVDGGSATVWVSAYDTLPTG